LAHGFRDFSLRSLGPVAATRPSTIWRKSTHCMAARKQGERARGPGARCTLQGHAPSGQALPVSWSSHPPIAPPAGDQPSTHETLGGALQIQLTTPFYVVTRGGTSPNSDIHIQKVQGSWLDDMHRSGWLWGGLDERIEAQTIFQNKKNRPYPMPAIPAWGG
jgi:hypothetical protein